MLAGVRSISIPKQPANPWHEEQQYLDLLKNLLEKGEERQDRTGTGTLSLFSAAMSFSLEKCFPLLTTKKLHFKSIVYELLWFLQGKTNIEYLKKNGVSIWDEWADERGELGPVYGAQWRRWRTPKGKTVDQIGLLIESIKKNPFSRRHILSSWNVGELEEMALPPCHLLAQFYVSRKRGLSCQFYQRSVDVFLGLPFNLGSYALLTYILAFLTGLFPEKLFFIGGDVHLYKNHLEQAQTQIDRKPFPFPSITLKTPFSLDSLDYPNIILEDYQCHPGILAPIAV